MVEKKQAGNMKFSLNITPVGQMRARACVRGRHAGTYKAKKQEQREQTLAAMLIEHRPSEPMGGPLVLHVDAHLPIPKSKPNQWKQDAIHGVVRPTTKPDADNLAKHLKDVLGQMQFWGDDKQVVELVVRKWYSDRPRWDVQLEEWKAVAGSMPLLNRVETP